MLVLVAALPIAAALILLVGLRLPAIRAMPVCAVVTILLAIVLWRVPPVHVAAATIEAAWITAGILLIIVGALFLLALLRKTGAIAVLQGSFARMSGDPRIQAVVVGWLLGSFLEGAAGFGTPAAITAPLLIGLGFPPMLAVIVALVGDSTAVSFGAVGTPMLVGMGEGLAGGELPDPAGTAQLVDAIAQRVTTFDLVLGTVMPAFLVLVLTVTAAGRRGWGPGLRAAPFAMVVGLVHMATAWLVVATLGPEFPSLLGPLAGFAAAALLLRSGRLLPAEPWALPHEPAKTPPPGPALPEQPLHPVRAFMPYLLLLALLVVTRSRALPLGAWLSAASVGMRDILGSGISARIQPLYSPGAVFVVCALLSALWLRARWSQLGSAARDAGTISLKTAVALLAAIITVRVFIHSGDSAMGREAMPMVLADAMASGLGGIWPLVAPWVGALGAFIAGSATFSNMLFALFQLRVATEVDAPATTILALQGIGAAAGNMVCVHNVVAACAVANILGQEGQVIRRTAVPMLLYLVLAGLIGLAAV